MPRVALSKIQYKPKDFVKWLAGEMRVKKIYQKDIARWLGVSRQAVVRKMRDYTFSYLDMLTIFDELGTDKETQSKVMLL